jgi:hypothetical protein
MSNGTLRFSTFFGTDTQYSTSNLSNHTSKSPKTKIFFKFGPKNVKIAPPTTRLFNRFLNFMSKNLQIPPETPQITQIEEYMTKQPIIRSVHIIYTSIKP